MALHWEHSRHTPAMRAQHSSSCSHGLCHHAGAPGEVTVLWCGSRVLFVDPTEDPFKAILLDAFFTSVPHLAEPALCPHPCFQHSECCFSMKVAWQRGRASEGITALGSELWGSDKYHQTVQECWHTSKSNSTGATSCRRNNSHSSYVKIPTIMRSACPALIQDGRLCLKAMQQTLPCLCKINVGMVPFLIQQGWQVSEVPDWLLEALERWHSLTTASSSRATKLLHTHPIGRPVAGGGGGSSAPSMTDVQVQCLLHQIIYYCMHSNGHLNILLLMINSANKRIPKETTIHFFKLWNLQLLLLLMLCSFPTSISPCLECSQSRKTRSIYSSCGSFSGHRWKWALHSLNLLHKPHLQKRGCLNVRQWSVVPHLDCIHLPILAPLLKLPIKFLFCAALSADLSK